LGFPTISKRETQNFVKENNNKITKERLLPKPKLLGIIACRTEGFRVQQNLQKSNNKVDLETQALDARLAEGRVMCPRLLPCPPQYCPEDYYLTPRPRGSLNNLVALPLPTLIPADEQVCHQPKLNGDVKL
jgi:hypothetical protein